MRTFSGYLDGQPYSAQHPAPNNLGQVIQAEKQRKEATNNVRNALERRDKILMTIPLPLSLYLAHLAHLSPSIALPMQISVNRTGQAESGTLSKRLPRL